MRRNHQAFRADVAGSSALHGLVGAEIIGFGIAVFHAGRNKVDVNADLRAFELGEAGRVVEQGGRIGGFGGGRVGRGLAAHGLSAEMVAGSPGLGGKSGGQQQGEAGEMAGCHDVFG